MLPLTRVRRFGLFHLPGRPAFTQQFGPYGLARARERSALLTTAGLRAQRENLLLDLERPYPDIRAGYGKTLRKSTRSPTPLESVTPDTVLRVYLDNVQSKAGLKPYHARLLRRLMAEATDRQLGHCYQYVDPDNGPLAAGFFPRFNGRITNLAAGSTPIGLRHRGMARLLDAVIRQEAERLRYFDFEGSQIPGVARFFRSFGSGVETYASRG